MREIMGVVECWRSENVFAEDPRVSILSYVSHTVCLVATGLYTVVPKQPETTQKGMGVLVF
jgi:hypothetical protein